MKHLWFSIFAPVLVWSAYLPKDPFTWFLEVLPVFIGLLLMIPRQSAA